MFLKNLTLAMLMSFDLLIQRTDSVFMLCSLGKSAFCMHLFCVGICTCRKNRLICVFAFKQKALLKHN